MEDTPLSMKGVRSYGNINDFYRSIFPRAKYPDKFQVPGFKKYNKSEDLYTHLKVYIGELGSYAKDESLMMQLI